MWELNGTSVSQACLDVWVTAGMWQFFVTIPCPQGSSTKGLVYGSNVGSAGKELRLWTGLLRVAELTATIALRPRWWGLTVSDSTLGPRQDGRGAQEDHLKPTAQSFWLNATQGDGPLEHGSKRGRTLPSLCPLSIIREGDGLAPKLPHSHDLLIRLTKKCILIKYTFSLLISFFLRCKKQERHMSPA